MITKIRITRAMLLSSLVMTGCNMTPSVLHGVTGATPPSAAGDDASRCAENIPWIKRAAATKTAIPAGKSDGQKVEVLYWCTKGAEKGDAPSQLALARIYDAGIGIPADRSKALQWYKAAANNGNPEAQFKVGQIYGRGEGVPEDKNEATRWYTKAADQGYVDAQYYMGYRCEHGKGITQSYTDAYAWYSKAAEQGNISAINSLGGLYLNGHGVPQSLVESYKWFNVAAASGIPEFKANRDKIAKRLNPAQLAEGQKLASEWAKTHTINPKITE